LVASDVVVHWIVKHELGVAVRTDATAMR